MKKKVELISITDSGAKLILKERARQIQVKRYSLVDDIKHNGSTLINAALAYVYAQEKDVAAKYWPWKESNFKPSEDHVKNLIKAGALIAAEIDRLNAVDGKYIQVDQTMYDFKKDIK